MKKLLIIFAIFMPVKLIAGCPDGFEEIPMENIIVTESGAQCGGGSDMYYDIDDLCTANVL